jgi:hypothetical protein
MNKVTIKLQGGIGNMLFQIATGYAYAKRFNKQFVFSKNKAVVIHQSVDSYSDNILSNIKLENIQDLSKYKTQNESAFHYVPIPDFNENILFNGYFQSEKYFKDYENEIKDMFMSYDIKFNDYIKNLLYNKNTCSIHVRRGDYLKFPNHHPTQSISYYMKAVKKMPKDSIFLVFSDDIEWCKNNFPNISDKFIFIEGNKDYEDLYIMSHCNNNIICNSTFSWWGAWLNKNKNKKVIAPSKWFGVKYNNNDTKDLYCEDWIKI